MGADRASDNLTYGTYLRVPELLDLQSPRSDPVVHDEMLFIISQQAQELWFKQILFDLAKVIGSMQSGDAPGAAALLERINCVVQLLGQETDVLSLLPPSQFHRFRGVLRAASGLESEQFREIEIASGLRDEAFLKLAGRFVDLPAILARWPVSLREAFLALLSVEGDPVSALTELYARPQDDPALYRLAEACSEYDGAFQSWRFHHLMLVERVIGSRASGTAGSPGSAYLARTVQYHFIPELWEARNRLTAETAGGVRAGEQAHRTPAP